MGNTPGIVVNVICVPSMEASWELPLTLIVIAGRLTYGEGNITGVGFRLSTPAPVVHRLPSECSTRTCGVPHRCVIAEIVREGQSSTGFMQYRNGDVRIEIGQVDDIRTATKGTERGVPVVTCARVEKQQTEVRMKTRDRRTDLRFFIAHPLGVSLERKRRRLGLNSQSQTESSSQKARFHSTTSERGTAPEPHSRLDNSRNRFRRECLLKRRCPDAR